MTLTIEIKQCTECDIVPHLVVGGGWYYLMCNCEKSAQGNTARECVEEWNKIYDKSLEETA